MNPLSTGSNLQGNSTGSSARNYKSFKETKAPKGFSKYSLRQFTPEQMGLLNQAQGQIGQGSYLQRLAGGDEDIFNQIEAPAMRQFAGLQGNIASRFSGNGLGGRQNSGFQNTMTDSASNFAQQLQSQRQGLQQGALRDIMSYTQMLLGQRPYDRGFAEKPQRQQENGWGETIGKYAGFLPGTLSGDFGGAAKGALSNIPFIGGLF